MEAAVKEAAERRSQSPSPDGRSKSEPPSPKKSLGETEESTDSSGTEGGDLEPEPELGEYTSSRLCSWFMVLL